MLDLNVKESSTNPTGNSLKNEDGTTIYNIINKSNNNIKIKAQIILVFQTLF